MKKLAFALLLIGFVVFSCKKDKNSGSSDSNTQLITSATWKYDTATLDYDKNGKPDMAIPPGTIATCTLDNTITFRKDSTGTLDEGATKCSSAAPQTTPFTWYFKSNDSLYSPNPIFGGLSGSAKILVLTSTKLEVTKEVSITGLPTTVNVILDLKH